MSVKLTYDHVKNIIESEGYMLLSEEYENVGVKLKIRCPENHIYTVTFRNFRQGKRCPVCAKKQMSDRQRLTYDHVKNIIESEGYMLLSTKYIDNRVKLDIQCSKRHEYKTSFSNFQQGHRCPICSKKIGIDKLRHTYEHVKNIMESTGYTLLSKEYINNHTKLDVKCPEGHKYRVKFNNFRHGQRCPVCVHETNSQKFKHDYKYVKNVIESEGYMLLSEEYENNYTKLDIQCLFGHKYSVTFGNFRQGKRCPVCQAQNGSSKAEKEIYKLVKLLIKYKVISNDRTQILNPKTERNLELDIWIPKLKLAIEFNGKHWHSFPETQERDKIKQEQCLTKGIDLLVVEEQDWKNNKEDCINQIKEFINGQSENYRKMFEEILF